jgi:glycosyltransferase involved in cell wall biosynthesis
VKEALTGDDAAPWSTAPQLIVAVLTYQRPRELSELLPELLRQAADQPRCAVLVVDNDPEAGARETVAAFIPGAAVELRYAHEPRPGIAAARNLALDEALGAERLVFIDDDERPVAGWLAALVSVHEQTGAGVVGPVVSEFVVEPDDWVRAGRFFDRRQLATGTDVTIAATNNLLLHLPTVRSLDLRFDDRFGLSGGSDTLFTRALVQGGGRLVWCAEALVVDRVPPQRVTRRWVLTRAFRSGNGGILVGLVLATTRRQRARVRLGAVGHGTVRVAAGCGQLLLGVATGSLRHRARGWRTMARGAGMLAAVGGHVVVEYARSPGTA